MDRFLEQGYNVLFLFSAVHMQLFIGLVILHEFWLAGFPWRPITRIYMRGVFQVCSLKTFLILAVLVFINDYFPSLFLFIYTYMWVHIRDSMFWIIGMGLFECCAWHYIITSVHFDGIFGLLLDYIMSHLDCTSPYKTIYYLILLYGYLDIYF